MRCLSGSVESGDVFIQCLSCTYSVVQSRSPTILTHVHSVLYIAMGLIVFWIVQLHSTENK